MSRPTENGSVHIFIAFGLVFIVIAVLFYTLFSRGIFTENAIESNELRTTLDQSNEGNQSVEMIDNDQPDQQSANTEKQYSLGDYISVKNDVMTLIDPKYGTGIELDIPKNWNYGVTQYKDDRFRLEVSSSSHKPIRVEIGHMSGGAEADPDAFEVLKYYKSYPMSDITDKYLVERIFCDQDQDMCRYVVGVESKSDNDLTVGSVVNRVNSSFRSQPMQLNGALAVAYIELDLKTDSTSPYSEIYDQLNSDSYIQSRELLMTLRAVDKH